MIVIISLCQADIRRSFIKNACVIMVNHRKKTRRMYYDTKS